MEFLKAPLTISQEFKTMKCGCGIEFMLFGIVRRKDEETGDEIIDFWPQASRTVCCPYCGKKGHVEKNIKEGIKGYISRKPA